MDLFTLTANVVLDDKDFNDSIDADDEKGQTFASNFGKAVEDAKKALIATGLVTAIVAVGKAFSSALDKTTSYADAVDKGSQSLGISAKYYQQLDYALSQSGSSVDSLGAGVAKLNDILQGKETGDAAEKFQQLGISLTYANGKSKSLSDVLEETLMALAGMEDVDERNNIAEKLFGRSAGQKMKAFLNEGQEGISDLMNEAEDLGLVMSDEEIEQAVATKDAMDKLSKTIDALVYEIMEPFLPVVQTISDVLSPAVAAIARVIGGLNDAIKAIADFMTGSGGEEEDPWKQYINRNDKEITTAYGKRVFEALIGEGITAEGMQSRYGADYETLANLIGIAQNAAPGTKESENAWNNFYLALGYAEQKLDPASTAIENFGTAAENVADRLNNLAQGTSGNASGLWDVPYEGLYHLHDDEMVLNASRARAYRRGEGGGSNAALMGMIQHMENALANLTLQVNGRDFGRAAVDYGGRRMNGYIGGTENRLAAGYGS